MPVMPDFSKIPEPEHIPLVDNLEDIKAILEEERAARIAAQVESSKQWKFTVATVIISIIAAVVAAVFSVLAYLPK